MLNTTFGKIRKATTTCKLWFSSSNSFKNDSLFKLCGCNTVKLCCKANCFTADCCNFCPRPAGRSGTVTTATTLNLLSSKAFRLSTANSGVPINTMRKSSLFILQNYLLEIRIQQIFFTNLFVGL